MADAWTDTFHAVKSMSIRCLWDIQLAFDRTGVGTYGAYHHKSELKRCNHVQFLFNLPQSAEVSAISAGLDLENTPVEPVSCSPNQSAANFSTLMQGFVPAVRISKQKVALYLLRHLEEKMQLRVTKVHFLL